MIKKYKNHSDGLEYAEVITPYGASLVVTNAPDTPLAKALNDITKSLSAWYQPFSIIYADGVAVAVASDELYYLKNIIFDQEENQYVISVYNTEVQFHIPCATPSFDFPEPLKNVTYTEVGSTNFFSKTILPSVNNYQIDTYKNADGLFVSVDNMPFKGTLYAISEHFIEIDLEPDHRHIIYAPGNKKISEALLSLSDKGQLHLAGDRILIVQKEIPYYVNIQGDVLKLSTLANPTLYFNMEELI